MTKRQSNSSEKPIATDIISSLKKVKFDPKIQEVIKKTYYDEWGYSEEEEENTISSSQVNERKYIGANQPSKLNEIFGKNSIQQSKRKYSPRS